MGKYLDKGEAFIVDHTPTAAAPIRKPRWSPADSKIEQLRKSRRPGETETHRAMREGGPIPGAEPRGGGAAEARPRPWPAGEEPMPVLSHGDVVHFARPDGALLHGRVRGLSRSGTHALVETRAGKFTVPVARLTPGRLRVNTESAVEKSLHQRFEYQGIPVSVEHRAGSMRRWRSPETDAEGFTRMRHRYGYIPGTSGMDGEAVDVMVGPWPDAPEAHVVKQLGRSGGVEELKVMLGFRSAAEAREAYLQHWPADIFGGIESMPVDALRGQLSR